MFLMGAHKIGIMRLIIGLAQMCISLDTDMHCDQSKSSCLLKLSNSESCKVVTINQGKWLVRVRGILLWFMTMLPQIQFE